MVILWCPLKSKELYLILLGFCLLVLCVRETLRGTSITVLYQQSHDVSVLDKDSFHNAAGLIMVFVCHLYRELSNQHSENLRTVLKYVIYNELSNTRNPNNMVLLSALFQNNQETAAKVCLFFFFIFSRSFVFKSALSH